MGITDADDNRESLQGAAKPKPKSAKVVAVGLLVLAALAGAFDIVATMMVGDVRFAVRSGNYEPLVGRIKTYYVDLNPETLLRFRLDNPRDLELTRDTSA